MAASWIKPLGEAARVMLIALILAVAAFLLRPALRPLASGARTSSSGGASSVQEAAPSISLEDALTGFKAGTVLFADARSVRAYQSGHIQSAMHLDPNDFDSWSENFFSQFPADTQIITYCDGAQCPLSSELAEKLIWLGYEKVYVLKNGWSLWKAAHLPIEQVAD